MVLTGLVATAALGVGAQAARASTWVGSSRGALVRSSNLVSGGTRWHGTFRFTVGRGGAVHGYAVAGFDPQVDVSGFNNAIAYIKSVAGAELGLLGPFAGPVSSVGLASIIGVSVSFDDAMAVRRGPLTGRLAHGHLTLHWGARLKPIGYKLGLETPGHTKRIGTGHVPLQNPFARAGSAVQRGEIVASSQKHGSSKGITTSRGTYWVAHRTN